MKHITFVSSFIIGFVWLTAVLGSNSLDTNELDNDRAASSKSTVSIKWTGEIRVTSAIGQSRDPAIDIDSDNDIHLCWVDDRDGIDEIFYKKIDCYGVEKVADISVSGSYPSSDPAITIDSENNANIVWSSFTDISTDFTEIYYKKLSPNGDTVIDTKRLTYGLWNSEVPVIDIDSGNNLHIVWRDDRELRSDIYYIKLNADGEILVNDTRLARVSPNAEPALAIDSKNNVHIVWNNCTVVTELEHNGELHYMKLNQHGEIIIDDTVKSTSSLYVGPPRIDGDKNNRISVVWGDGRNLTSLESIYYLKMDEHGQILVADAPLTNKTINAWDPTIAVDTLENAHIVWTDNREGISELVYTALDTNADIIIHDELVTTGDNRTSIDADTAVDSMNRVHLCWSDNRDGNFEIYYKHTIVTYEGIDLQVSADDIRFAPATPYKGDQVTITATIYNLGKKDMTVPTAVEFFDGDPGLGGTEIGAGEIKVAAGGSEDVSIQWTALPGNHIIYVVVDPDDAIAEVDETNNVASRLISVSEIVLIADAGEDQSVVVGEVVNFDGSGSTCSEGEIDEYNWDFGDGTSANGIKVNHTYNTAGKFTVRLEVVKGTVSDEDTCLVTVVPVNVPPVADAGENKIAFATEIIEFDATGSYDPDGVIVSYYWDFGDDSFAEGAVVKHSYERKATYRVTLTVTDNDGAEDQDTCVVTIRNAPPVPVAGEDMEAKVGQTIKFDASASYDPDGKIIEYSWDFDASDGLQDDAVGVTATHTYTERGKYVVTLIVIDNDDEIAMDQINVTIVGEEPGVRDKPRGEFIPVYLGPVSIITIFLAVAGTLKILKSRRIS
jgi:PKD repeat protein